MMYCWWINPAVSDNFLEGIIRPWSLNLSERLFHISIPFFNNEGMFWIVSSTIFFVYQWKNSLTLYCVIFQRNCSIDSEVQDYYSLSFIFSDNWNRLQIFASIACLGVNVNVWLCFWVWRSAIVLEFRHFDVIMISLFALFYTTQNITVNPDNYNKCLPILQPRPIGL